ncbi:MAG: CPBP family intramembrane metalloprotease, partial [Clostridia bacterium]|nr:CPBP family intramembrane metalloprotease [Clostridia bacterium]
YEGAVEEVEQPREDEYSVINMDEIGKFSAYAPKNEGATQRKDFGTRALYDLTDSVSQEQDSAVLKKAAETISRNIRRESGRIGFTLLIFIAVQMVIIATLVTFTAIFMGWSIDEVYDFVTQPRSMAMLQGGILLVGMAFPFLGYIFVHRLPIAEMVPLHRLRRGELLPMTSMGLAMMMVVGCLTNYMNHGFGLRGANYSLDVVSFGTSLSDMLLTFAGLGVVPALVESFVFHGVILQVLRRRGGDSFALILSSLFFALMTTNFVEMPGAFLSALWIGYMVIFSGSLVPAIVIKLVERTLFFVITQLGFIISNTGTVHFIDALVTMAIIAFGIAQSAVALRRFPEFFVLKKSDPCLTLGEKLSISLKRPMVIIVILYSVFFSLMQIFSLDDIIAFADRLTA